MSKRALLAIAAVFVTWIVLDMVIHNIILRETYAETANLWRSKDEMKMGVMILVIFISAFAFVYIYEQLISSKNLFAALRYGVAFGLAMGISMGYGTYAVMPIPYSLELSWFLGTLVETTAAGLLVGWIVTENKQAVTIEE